MTAEEWNLLEQTVLEKIVHQRACADHVRRVWIDGYGDKASAMARYNETADMLEGIITKLATIRTAGRPLIDEEWGPILDD